MTTYTILLDRLMSAPLNDLPTIIERELPSTIDYPNNRKSMLTRSQGGTKSGNPGDTGEQPKTMLGRGQPEQPQKPAAGQAQPQDKGQIDQMVKTAQDELRQIISRAKPETQKVMVQYAIQQLIKNASQMAGKGQRWKMRASHQPVYGEEKGLGTKEMIDRLTTMIAQAVYKGGKNTQDIANKLKSVIVNIRQPFKFGFETDKWKQANLVPEITKHIKKAVANGNSEFLIKAMSRDPRKNEQIVKAYKDVFNRARIPVGFGRDQKGVRVSFEAGLRLVQNIRKLGKQALAKKPAPSGIYSVKLDYQTEDLLQFVSGDTPAGELNKILSYHLAQVGIPRGKFRIFKADDSVPSYSKEPPVANQEATKTY